MDFTGFILALGKDWFALMSGVASVIFTVLGFLKHKIFKIFKTPERQRKIYWGMALLCFFLAAVSVWTNEHRKVTNLTYDLERERDRSTPKLSAEIVFVGGLHAGEKNQNSVVVVQVNINNDPAGAPSIVRDVKMSVRSGDTEVQGAPMLVPTRHIKFGNVYVKSEDYLPNKCKNLVIMAGGGVTGFYWAFIRGLSLDQVLTAGTIITITFKDVKGKTCHTEYIVTGKPRTSTGPIDPTKIQIH